MYTAEISRENPTLILFLFDCSYSMSEKYGDTGLTKGEYLAKIANESLDQLVLSCEKGDELRSYFEVGILGYGEGKYELMPIQSILQVAENPTEMISTEMDGVKIDRPIWIKDPTRETNTDMKSGFEYASELLLDWIDGHKSNFPPVLIHVSDGEWTTGSPVEFVQQMQENIFTDDGNVVILNIHISDTSDDKLTFPEIEPTSSDHQKGLFNMSSVLPDSFLQRAKEIYPAVQPGARGYMFNAQPDDLSKFFDIGTRLIG
ncbi:MAG: vWA domain-containing protein [Leptospirales bacterium]